MNKSLLFKTPLGQLRINSDNYEIETDRVIDFKEGALTISGLNTEKIYSNEPYPQDNQSALIVRDLEKYLLDKSHSFTREKVKGFVSKFGLDKTYSESFSISIDLKYSEKRSYIILLDSDTNDTKSYRFEIVHAKVAATERTSCTICVEDNADRFVNALENVCRVADAINKGKLSNFIVKIPFLFPK